VAPDHC